MGQTQFRSDDTVKWWLGFGNGSDGNYSSTGNATDAPIDSSCSGSATSTSLSATNASFAAGKPVLIHQSRGTGAGNWELNQIDSYTAGTITLAKALQNTYTDSGASQAQVIQLKQYTTFTQNSGHTLTAKAWNGNVGGIIAFLCNGTVTITGSLSLTGRGFIGGVVGANNQTQRCGEGTVGGSAAQTTANGNGGGGGVVGVNGSRSSGGGAGGGHAASGTNGSANNAGSSAGGTGGGASGNVGLTSLTFGGSGGTAGGINNGSNPGDGGNSGGNCLIIGKSLSINGTIVCNGNVGGNGTGDTGGGGGGAGGSVLLKFEAATLGTNKITASAGAGGARAGDAGAGGAGAVGRIHLDYSVSYTGTTTPTINATLDPTIKAGGADFFAFF